jgi:aryl-alcohol dehydrogenase-like predicted oxidoreductase
VSGAGGGAAGGTGGDRTSGAVPAVRLGRTGLRASRMGVGLAALGRPAYITLGHADHLGPDTSPDALRTRTFAVLDAARARGVRYVDAARSYGMAEDFLGAWLRARDIAPGEITVGSKWGYRYTAGWRRDATTHEVKDLSAEMLRRQLAETRERLGAHLSLYQIHSATVESGVLEDEAVLAELRALRDEGVAIGLSVTGPRQADTIRLAVRTGAFDTVQATWNLLERSAGEALAAAHEAGMGVIVKEGVANGRLAGGTAPAPLQAAARRLGTTPDAVALAAALAQPWADVVLSGAATPAMLHSNLAAVDLDVHAVLDDLLAALGEPPDAYWQRRSELPWT